MPSLLWLAEDEYREWTAVRFKKRAESLAFPQIAQRAASLYRQGVTVLPPEPPPEPPEAPPPPAAAPSMEYAPAGPVPSEPALATGIEPPTRPAPSFPLLAPTGEMPEFLPRPPGFGPGGPPSDIRSALAPGLRPTSLTGYRQPETPMPGDITTLASGVRGGLDIGGPEVRRAFAEFPGSPESILGSVIAWPGAGAIGRIGGPAAPTARAAMPRIVEASEAFANLPKLGAVLDEVSKASRRLNIGSWLKTEKAPGIRVAGDLDALLDASKHQAKAVQPVGEAPAVAVDAAWHQLGKPLAQDSRGIIAEGPAAGNALQDVLQWGPEKAQGAGLRVNELDFLKYWQDGLAAEVAVAEARGARIPKVQVPPGEVYSPRQISKRYEVDPRTGIRKSIGSKQTNVDFERGRRTVTEMINAGDVEARMDLADLRRIYSLEIWKKVADRELLQVLKPLGQTVLERVPQTIKDVYAIALGQRKAAQRLAEVAGWVTKGATPSGATLKAIRDDFPTIAGHLDDALAIKPPEFNRIIEGMSKEVWDQTGTSPARFRQALTQIPGGPSTRKPISYPIIKEALELMGADEKTSLEMIGRIYKEVFAFPTRQRAQAIADVLREAGDNMTTLTQQFRMARGAYRGAAKEAGKVRAAEGVIKQPGFAKIIFPETVDSTQQVGGRTVSIRMSGRDFADRVNRALDPQKEIWLASTLAKGSTLGKAQTAALDMSAPFIQGFPMLMSIDPRDVITWGKATALHYATLLRPETRELWLARPENFQAFKGFIEAGGMPSSTDFVEAAQKGGLLTKMPILGQAYERSGKAFTTFADLANVMAFDGARGYIAAKGAHVAPEVADVISEMVGRRTIYGPNIGRLQGQIEQIFGFAPSYLRASLALAADAAKPGVQGSLARRTIGKMVAAYGALVAGSAVWADMADEKEPFSPSARFTNPDHPDNVFNVNGRYFMRPPWTGENDVLALGGIWPSLMRTSARAAVAASEGNPERFVQAWRDFGVSRIGVIPGIVKTQVEGQSFGGEPLDTTEKRAAELGKSLTPFTAQAALEGMSPGTVAGQFVGLGAYKKSPAAKRDELLDAYAKEAKGVPWRELSLPEQDDLRKAHPDVIQATDLARSRAVTSGRGDWQVYAEFQTEITKNRERYRAEIADLTRQFKAKEISGQVYRDAVQDREFAIGRIGKTLQSQDRYQKMPVTTEEYEAWRKQVGFKEAPKNEERAFVDTAIQGYYAISDEYSDANGFVKDMPGFMRAREQFLAGLPPNIRGQVEPYLNRNKDPELVQAQREMSQLMKIPAFLLKMSPEEEDAIEGALARLSARSGLLHPFMKNKQTLAFMQELQVAKTPEARAVLERAFIIMKKPALRNPQRRLFRSQHPLLQKYYSDVILD